MTWQIWNRKMASLLSGSSQAWMVPTLWIYCHTLCKDMVSHQCEFVHEKSFFKLLGTLCSSLRFVTRVDLFMTKINPNFLSNSCQNEVLLFFLSSEFLAQDRIESLSCSWLQAILSRNLECWFYKLEPRGQYFWPLSNYLSLGENKRYLWCSQLECLPC